jgi:hypothetical protein
VSPRPVLPVAILGLVALLGATSPSRAQLSVSADATAATVHYDGYLRSGVALFTPVVRYEGSSFTIAARGNFSVFQSGNRSVDLLGTTSVFTPELNVFRGELSATGGISSYRAIDTGYGTLGLRAHAIGRRGGAWIGAGGSSVTSGRAVQNGRFAEGGAWGRAWGLAATLQAKGFDVDLLQYIDTELAMRWSRGRLELSGSAGGRAGDETEGARAWGELSATVWLGQRVALVLGHGSYPNDQAQLTPGGQYTAVSLRIASRPTFLRDALARTVRYETPPIAPPVVAGFEVRRSSSTMVRIRIRAPDASSVELAGDFTNWEPIALRRRRGDSWEVTLPIEPGRHELNVRVDGGEWGIPPGIDATRDEFGGVVGVLVVT